MKPKLVIPSYWQRLGPWNQTICRSLVASGMFDASEANLPRCDDPRVRNNTWHTMRVADHLVAVDTWDTAHPTAVYGEQLLQPGGVYGDVELIIKIQANGKCWLKWFERIKQPIRPWTIFPNQRFLLGGFRWQNKPHRYLATLSGMIDRWGREAWVDEATKLGNFWIKKRYERNWQTYLDILADTKWGFVIHGRIANGDGKNRRQCEYASCGMPLALNLKPTFSFPFAPDIDYLYLAKPSDLVKLGEVDPAPFAKRSFEIYNDYLSPVGMAKELLKLVAEL